MNRPTRTNPGRALAILLVLGTCSGPALSQDNLVPEAGLLNLSDWELGYQSRVREALLRGSPPYYVARVVCLTAGDEGEWAVTIVRRCDGEMPPGHRHSYAVE